MWRRQLPARSPLSIEAIASGVRASLSRSVGGESDPLRVPSSVAGSRPREALRWPRRPGGGTPRAGWPRRSGAPELDAEGSGRTTHSSAPAATDAE